ncbi:MAG: S1/P1 Nuclease [Flavobacteriales bacterium]|nr:S1/P1 Nuclease [Flavobacteriales bacterium]
MAIPGKKTTHIRILLLVTLLLIKVKAFPWGFQAHKQINYCAVFTLHPDLFGFYKKYIDEITDRAVNADMRRYVNEKEACRHYLDTDHYELSHPIDSIPVYWKDAVLKFSEDTLNKYGIVPWNLYRMKGLLTQAFENKDLRSILRLSADIGHYAGDLHVPLHSTKNYNGQLTGQEGIHGLWESRLFELFKDDYDKFVGKASYIKNLQTAIWMRFGQSFAALDSVLYFEKQASLQFRNKYAFVKESNGPNKKYSENFCKHYHMLLNGMVERRFRSSIEFTGSIWFTAWVDAGQPDLSNLEDNRDSNERENDKILIQKIIEVGKMIGRGE